MHSDVAVGLQNRYNNIATYVTGYQAQPNNLIPEIVGALNLLGYRHFATLTVNNFNIVQRTISSFAAADKFFGRDLGAVIDDEVLVEVSRTGTPAVRPCGLLLSAPFDQVFSQEEDQRYFALYSIFRDKFTRGFVVIFGNSAEALSASLWPLQTVAQLAVEATVKIPLTPSEPSPLRPQEIDALRWTYQHKTAAEVAEILEWTVRAVNHHLVQAIKKLGAKNKGHAAQLAHDMGLFN